MTVKELKERLKGWPDDMPVVLCDRLTQPVRANVGVRSFSVDAEGLIFIGTIEEPNPPFWVQDCLVIS